MRKPVFMHDPVTFKKPVTFENNVDFNDKTGGVSQVKFNNDTTIIGVDHNDTLKIK